MLAIDVAATSADRRGEVLAAANSVLDRLASAVRHRARREAYRAFVTELAGRVTPLPITTFWVGEYAPGERLAYIGQDLFAAAVAHSIAGFRIGASAQYARSSDILNQDDAVRLGIGLHYALPIAAVPITLAGTAQSQDETTLWSAAVRAAPRLPFQDWTAGATYGAAGETAVDGVSHRLTAHAVWRELVTIEGGAVREAESGGHTMTAIGSIGVRVNRYELGVVRESLANAFGAVHTFRIGILF